MDNNADIINSTKSLSLSRRIARMIVSVILVVIVMTEDSLPAPWLLVLSAITVYTIVTGLLGWDPLLKLLQLEHLQLPDQPLSFAAQLECAAIGGVCIGMGIFYRSPDSLLLSLLPFLGIYPILICAIKYDLLDYILRSYRRRTIVTKDTD